MSIVPHSVKKIPAGILAIFLGSFGLHKYFLGRNSAGTTLLALYIFGWLLSHVPFIGFIGLPIVGFIHIFTIVEGFVLIFKSDHDFYWQYIMGKREWL